MFSFISKPKKLLPDQVICSVCFAPSPKGGYSHLTIMFMLHKKAAQWRKNNFFFSSQS